MKRVVGVVSGVTILPAGLVTGLVAELRRGRCGAGRYPRSGSVRGAVRGPRPPRAPPPATLAEIIKGAHRERRGPGQRRCRPATKPPPSARSVRVPLDPAQPGG